MPFPILSPLTVPLLSLASIIRLLNTAQGSLLDDEKLVNTLQISKTTALEVEEQLEVSVQTEQKIDTAREVSCQKASKVSLVKLATDCWNHFPILRCPTSGIQALRSASFHSLLCHE